MDRFMGHARSNSESPLTASDGSFVDLRAELDAIDSALIELLSRRFALVRNAARFQVGEDLSDENWHRQLVLSACHLAFEHHVPVGLVSDTWERLADASIALHRQAHARLRAINE